jgi:ABC-type multidrug transport system ATPase subunit
LLTSHDQPASARRLVEEMGTAVENVVETKGLSKRYGGRMLAVQNLDLNVRRGEVYGFLGPNGAGKTTTLRMLVGLIRPTAGSALVVGEEPGSPAGLARIGCVIESSTFYPYLSGRDNLRVAAHYAAVGTDKVEAALEEVDLASRAKDKYGTYSQGMRQRLGLAAALMKEPELLILDEPTNGLDPQGVVEMRELIRRLGQGNRTVLLSSHQLGEVEQICQRVGVIHRGLLVAEGSLDELRGQGGLMVRAAPEEAARKLLEEVLGTAAVSPRDGAFQLRTDPARAAELNTRMVQAGLAVSELRPQERSLEEAFLRLTGQEGGR